VNKEAEKDKKRVLLVDDERAILKILSIKLKISGYDVIATTSGKEALDLIVSAYPDIMLLDVVMPGMDGFEVLEKLRTSSELPVIVFSARPENAQKALALGANDFIAKPLDFDRMIKRIEKMLDRKS
jgi:two-component system, OmpR family, KDP operon response regulator KdpE